MLTINRKEFTDAFLAASRCVNARTTIETIKNVMVTVRGGSVTLTATDSENEIQVSLEGRPTRNMEFLLPADRFATLLKEVDGDDLKIRVEKDVAEIECGESKYKIPLVDADGFPPFTGCDGDGITISGSRLIECIRRTAFIVDASNTGFQLSGIQIRAEKGKLAFVGTDQRRMGVDICDVECDGGEKAMVPRKLCQVICDAIDPSEDAELTLGENRMAVKQSGKITVAGKYLAGKFPDYKRVIPDDRQFGGVVSVPPKQLAAVVRRALVTSALESRAVEVSFSKSELAVENTTKDVGKSSAKMPCSFSGEDVSVLLDGKYLLEALSAAGDSVVDVSLTDGTLPVVVSCGNYKHALMPLYDE